MNLIEQAGVLVCGIEEGVFSGADAVRWADGILCSNEKAPHWVIEVATANPDATQDLISLIRGSANRNCTTSRKVELLAHARFSGVRDLASTLPSLFRILIVDRDCQLNELSELELELRDGLIDWDIGPEFPRLGEELQHRIDTNLTELVERSPEIGRVFSWKFPSSRS